MYKLSSAQHDGQFESIHQWWTLVLRISTIDWRYSYVTKWLSSTSVWMDRRSFLHISCENKFPYRMIITINICGENREKRYTMMCYYAVISQAHANNIRHERSLKLTSGSGWGRKYYILSLLSIIYDWQRSNRMFTKEK